MAIVWFEHFDLYGGVRDNLLTRGYDSFINTNSVLNTTARNGSHAFLLGSNNTLQRLRRALPAAADVVGIGCAVERVSNGATANSSAGLRLDDGTVTYAVVIDGNNGLSLYRDNTLLASTAASIVPAGSYVWIEMKADSINDTLAVRLNGVEVLSASTTVGPITHFSIGKNTAGTTARFDDLVVWDGSGTVNNDWLGDTFVLVAAPDADGPLDQWVPSTGSDAWAMVDEASPSDADFITGSTVGDVQEFGHVALNLPVGAVAAIASQTRALKTDAGASSIEVGLQSNGSTSMSAEVALAVSATSQSHISNLNPDGNVPWTQAAAQAARLRVRRAA